MYAEFLQHSSLLAAIIDRFHLDSAHQITTQSTNTILNYFHAALEVAVTEDHPTRVCLRITRADPTCMSCMYACVPHAAASPSV